MQFCNAFNKYIYASKYMLVSTSASIMKLCTFINTQNKWPSWFPAEERLRLTYSYEILLRKLRRIFLFNRFNNAITSESNCAILPLAKQLLDDMWKSSKAQAKF